MRDGPYRALTLRPLPAILWRQAGKASPPLAIRQLAYVGSVVAHHEQLPIRPGNAIHQRRLILETHARAAEGYLIAI
jgi:hypothetical protein